MLAKALKCDSSSRPSVSLSSVLTCSSRPTSLLTKSCERRICGQCEKQSATVKCLVCQELFCKQCFDLFHAKGMMKTHCCETLKVSHKTIFITLFVVDFIKVS